MTIIPAQVAPNVVYGTHSASNPNLRSQSSNLQDAPKGEKRQTAATSSAFSIPQTEVKVHPDTSAGANVLIYEFVDAKSGSLVYQIPSEQMLGLMHAIQQQLERLSSTAPNRIA